MNRALRKITRSQATDTGMALVLLALLLGIFTERRFFYPLATGLLLVNMTFPLFYRPVAVVWLGLARLLSAVSSRILLTLLFVLLVIPVGVWRRWRGQDPLLLKAFRQDRSSAMKVREHPVAPADLDKPY